MSNTDIQIALDAVAQRVPEAVRISEGVWDTPELCFNEHAAVALQIDYLEKQGFRIERNVAGMATAFTAEVGEEGPVIAFLGEYDALPSLSQEAGAVQAKPVVAGGNGHGCGHNLLCGGTVLAAVALKDILASKAIKARVRYYGCPAEEGGSGKTFMARAGAFDDADVALNWHPACFTAVKAYQSLAVLRVKFRFQGQASHASAAPHLGRSALDAVELMNVGSNYLREHIPPGCQLHYAITDAGGPFPNVVQAQAEVIYYIRSESVVDASTLQERVEQVAQGAALMTGTRVEIVPDYSCSNVIYNSVLDELLYEHIQRFGEVEFDDDDRAYATALRRSFSEEQIRYGLEKFQAPIGKDEPLSNRVIPRAAQLWAGSSDVGDVSWVTPTVSLYGACYAIGTEFHTWQMVTQGKSPAAHKGMAHAAAIMVSTALDIIARPQTVRQAKSELLEKRGHQPYRCPIPGSLQPPMAAQDRAA
ncbi:amidohydrolase [Aquamicrobium terrae]|mgnify:CR=1 FL=1|uniref:Aminobenzoyl-glutamate utilization protein B n=1 Tax=Aquamicrobium terrae TaxID=1324945 RepID=A0ABV2N4B5_9HYPH